MNKYQQKANKGQTGKNNVIVQLPKHRPQNQNPKASTKMSDSSPPMPIIDTLKLFLAGGGKEAVRMVVTDFYNELLDLYR